MAEGPYGLPEGWAWKPLPEVADIAMGQSPPGSSYNSNQTGLPFFQGKADFGELYPTARVWCDNPKKVAEPGDILISVRAPVGPTNIAAETCAIGRGLAAIRPRDGLPPRLLREYFVHIERAIAEKGTGSTFTAVNKEILESLVFPLPPLPEQQRLVEKIERLLEQSRTAREALDRIPPLLKRFRQAVLAKAFRGELTERDPNDEPASVLLERIREERRRKWEEDLRGKGKDPRKAKYVEPEPPDTGGLPELPNGWSWTTVSHVTENHDGMRIPIKETKRKEMPGPYPYYGASGIIGHINGFIFDGEFLLVGEDGANLLNRTSPIAFRATGRFWVNNHAHVLQTLGDVPLSYLEYFFGSIDLTPYVTGTAQPKMTQANMNSVPLPLAPPSEQRRLVNKIDTLFAQADVIHSAGTAARRRASSVDRAVLARAFRGEL
jgi:type I restriction enzyme S subunit